MFTKALFLVLLGVSLVMANPINPDSAETERLWNEKLADWLQKVEDKLTENYQQQKVSFEDAFAEVQRDIGHAVEISKEQYAELKRKYDEIKEKVSVALAEKKMILEARIEELKHVGAYALASGTVKFQELKEKFQHAIEAEKANLEAKVAEWKQTAKEYIEAAKNKLIWI